MKIKFALPVQIALLFFFAYNTQAQENAKSKSLNEKDLIFTSVKNGFTYELKLPEMLNLYELKKNF